MFKFKLLILVTTVAAVGAYYEDLAAKQIIDYAKSQKCNRTLTTANGCPVEYRDAYVTHNKRFIFNEYFMETITHFNRQRIPERPVHAKGTGAFGYFEVTHDVTDICKADFLNQVGKITPVVVRFSLTTADLGGVDTSRETRGFGIKFYTQEGNFDIAGLNTPVFQYNDPLFFPTNINSQGRNPATNLEDVNTLWDFITLIPSSIHSFLFRFGDGGIPDGYRFMPGFGVHTFQVVNAQGKSSFVRFHFIPKQGTRNLDSAEGKRIGGLNPDYATKDLYNAIANKDYPSWQVSVQSLCEEEVRNADFDVFDVTKELPLDKYPLRPVGCFKLNKTITNQFAEIEQLALDPGNLVPGILGAPDKLFEARRLAYRDAQYYRLGANFQSLPINCPLRKPETYNIAGFPELRSSGGPIYYPNSYNGPVPYVDPKRVELIKIYQDPSANNFDQASKKYESLCEDAKKRLICNIVTSLGQADQKLQIRALKWFNIINCDLASRVERGLLQFNKSSTEVNSRPKRGCK